MDPRRATPPPWLPASRQQPTPPAVPEPAQPPPQGPPPPGSGPRFRWRRFLRSPRGAAGVALLAAALLLWPFAGLSWIPWLVGLAALVVLRLLRLDGILRGWDLPLAGLVVVVGLMTSTGPWAWALAGSIGVLLAGLTQLPWWRLAGVGAVLCLISGVGYGISSFQSAELQRQIESHAGDPMRVQLGETRPARVLPAMVHALELNDADPICRLLTPEAEGQLLGSVQAPDCSTAVEVLNGRSATGPVVDEKTLPQPQPTAGGWTVDGCATAWGQATGPGIGRVSIAQTAPSVQRYAVTGFSPC
jgi:hypothetical protein